MMGRMRRAFGCLLGPKTGGLETPTKEWVRAQVKGHFETLRPYQSKFIQHVRGHYIEKQVGLKKEKRR